MKANEKQKIAFCCPHHGVLQNDVEYISADVGSKRLSDVAVMYCHECNEYYTPFTNLLALAKLEYRGKRVLASQGRADKTAFRVEVKKPIFVNIESKESPSNASDVSAKREEVITVPDLTKLTKQQMEYLCQQMSPKDIRSYFQKFPKDFTRIRPGFRPNALSDADTINLMIRHSDKPFIKNYIDNTIKQWLKEIADYRKEKESEGYSPDESLLLAIPQSFFAGNVELYLALCDEEYTPEYARLLEGALSVLKKTALATTTEVPREEARDSELKIEELTQEIEQLQVELSEAKKAHMEAADELAESNANNAVLQQNLSAAEARIDDAASKSAAMQEELEQLRKLAKYSDSDVLDASAPDYEYTSICQVYFDHYSGQTWLTRLADIHAGRLSKFVRIEDQPYHFGNRDRLFWRDGPRENGYIGIWHWNAVPNQADPNTDYVTTSYSKYGKVIEVVELHSCRTFDDIVQHISKKGVPYTPGRKYFFALSGIKGSISGLLCSESDFDILNGTATLKATTCVLPQFVISSADVIAVADRKFYRFTNMGTPQDTYCLKSPLEVVKDIVVSRATGTALRQQGITKKEAQHCQLFLTGLPAGTLVQEIADAYGCTETEAAEYLANFLELAETYLNESDLDVGTLSAALSRNPNMVEKCKQLLTEEWRAEHEEAIREAQAERNQIAEETAAFNAKVHEAKGLIEALLVQRNEIEDQIAAKLQLATDVETRVADRIAGARANAADFICEMAFAVGHNGSVPNPVPEPKKHAAVQHNIPCNNGGHIDDIDMLEEELACNFNALGYNAVSANQMAQVVVFSICNKQSILCGSNAAAIADAISAALYSVGAYEITMPLASDRCIELCEALTAQFADARAVILLNGVFDGYSMNTYSAVQQYASQWQKDCVLLFSINGIAPESIPTAVWDNAWFIDGNAGLTQFPHGSLNGFNIECSMTLEFDEQKLKAERKTLKKFSGILSDRAVLNYAGYLLASESEIKNDIMLSLQLLIQAKAQNKTDEMVSLLETAGIDVAANKLLSRYL